MSQNETKKERERERSRGVFPENHILVKKRKGHTESSLDYVKDPYNTFM